MKRAWEWLRFFFSTGHGGYPRNAIPPPMPVDRAATMRSDADLAQEYEEREARSLPIMDLEGATVPAQELELLARRRDYAAGMWRRYWRREMETEEVARIFEAQAVEIRKLIRSGLTKP